MNTVMYFVFTIATVMDLEVTGDSCSTKTNDHVHIDGTLYKYTVTIYYIYNETPIHRKHIGKLKS